LRPLKLPSKSARAKAESKALWNEARSVDAADFFTAGYEGRTANQLIALFLDAGVRSVLDIRHTPVSMYKPELSKSNFQRTVEAAGLQYMHLREWGVPREIRAKSIETASRDIIWEWYDEAVVTPHFEKNLHRFLNLDHPVAMMCVEADPCECHRHRLFVALERHGLRGYDL
jgi:uncharacterized protein (DUF488 family)